MRLAIYNLTLAVLNTVFVVHDVHIGLTSFAWFNGAIAIGCGLIGATSVDKRSDRGSQP